MSPRIAVRCCLAVAIAAPLSFGSAKAQLGPGFDAEVERCLREGQILKKIKTLKGVTRPELFQIECNDDSRPVVFKSLDEYHRGVTQFEKGGWEVNFSDSYRYERAAYLLDRELGLNMVPVAVIREVKRNDGALVAWIENASHENDTKKPPTPQQMAALARYKATMRIFDALIYNVDRNLSNWLVDDADWQLYLIDHSRGFREAREVPKEFLDQRVWLSRDLHDRLRGLHEEELARRLEGIISRGQIRALLARRDQILAKIDNDREQHGDAMVFSD